MKRWMWVLVIGLLGLTACVTLRGVTPIYPEAGSPGFPAVVDSLQPTFRWEPSSEADANYDLIIYEKTSPTQGRRVYYRESIKKPEHKAEEPLKPSTEYFWSIRVRRGEKVGDWSRRDSAVVVPLPFVFISSAGSSLFIFKTPDKWEVPPTVGF